MSRLIIPREILYEKYFLENMSARRVAFELGTTTHNVIRQIKEYGWEARGHSAAQKLSLDQSEREHPTKGRKRTIEERKAIGKGVAEHFIDNPDAVKKRSDIAKRVYKNRTDKESLHKKTKKALRKSSEHGSKLEKLLLLRLTSLGYNLERQVQDVIGNENLRIDLFLPEQGVAIECDGPLHRRLLMQTPEQYEKRRESDRLKNQLLLSEGYVVFRIIYDKSITKGKGWRLVENLDKELKALLDDRPKVVIYLNDMGQRINYNES